MLLLIFRTPDVSVDSLKRQYTDSNSHFMSVDGLEVHYKDEGSGTPIILLHGTSASLHTWDGWTKELTINNYRVIRMDLPAFGITGANKDNLYDLPSYSKFLTDFVNQLELDKFILAGNSLGGSISWHYTSSNPEKVQKLILLDPAGFPSKKERPLVFELAEIPILNQILKHITPKSLIKDNLEQVYFDDSKVTENLVDRYHQMILRKGSRAAFIERAKLEGQDYTELLYTIKSPTLIIWGEDDLWIPVEDGFKFKERMANSNLVIMKETGHVPMEEKPLESLALALNFLNLEIENENFLKE
ncbi:alpha/beta fold hydrolase [Candidatus Arcticimaribacter forsetii]|jgi:pimeloyl-ACP methyl ester carboxylesterase|uniref:alpha/beta fold hydrolase n=1 Tax=Candidatus Arcticimaribacter forsetii TaxID=2820661 RepID=UPI002077742F|nr:alpha/beta hydrolase [Candidatus Arcticimaribacter forsetii]MDB2325443.1 alpha/beta hydrolase [Flavobacteriaceae bacterium]